MKRTRLASFTAAVLLSMAVSAQAAESIKVGFLTTLSGPGAALGQEIRDGFNLGVKHSGDKLGGLPVDLRGCPAARQQDLRW